MCHNQLPVYMCNCDSKLVQRLMGIYTREQDASRQAAARSESRRLFYKIELKMSGGEKLLQIPNYFSPSAMYQSHILLSQYQ